MVKRLSAARMKDATASPAATQLMETADSEELAFHSVEEKEEEEDVEEEEEERKEGEDKLQASSTHTSDSSDSKKKDTGIHQQPAGDCLVCFEPLVTSNYAEYSLNPHSTSSSSLQQQQQQEDPHKSREEKGGDDENDDTKKNAKTDPVSATADSSSIDATPDISRSKKTQSQTLSNSADIKDSRNNNADEQVIWYPAKFCKDCIEELQAVQFQRYCDAVANTNCAREQRALLKRGPPINLRDRMAFPESNDEEIHSLWYAADNEVRSAKLKGSLEGEKRKALWTWLEQFLIVDEKVEDDVNGKKTESS